MTKHEPLGDSRGRLVLVCARGIKVADEFHHGLTDVARLGEKPQ